MDDKEIDKIVKLVKDGKITVSNDTLAFTKDYVKKQNKRTISGPSHEKGINYLSKNLKLSDKVSFYCTKSGKLTLRGGKDAAKDLHHDIKVSLKSKRIGETRRAVYSSIRCMLEAYINDFETKSNTRNNKKAKSELAQSDNVSEVETTSEPAQPDDVSEVEATSEPAQQNDSSSISQTKHSHVNVVHNFKIADDVDNLVNGTSKKSVKTTDDIKNALFNKVNSLNEISKFYLLTKLYSELTHSNQTNMLYDYLTRQHSHFALLNSMKILLFRKKVKDDFISKLCDDPSSALAQDFYVLYSNQCKFIQTPKYKEQVEKIREDYYKKLTRKQRYKMRINNIYYEHYSEPNIFKKTILFFQKTSEVDDEVFDDIFYNTHKAKEDFETFINSTTSQDSEKNSSDTEASSFEKKRSTLLKDVNFPISSTPVTRSIKIEKEQSKTQPTYSGEQH